MVEFNKMFVMIPVMLAARKLDGEDPNTVNILRIAYAVMQCICVVLVLYTYYAATKVTNTTVVYVPPPAQPFADPNAKKKYTEISYAAHVASTARSLAGSTIFGIGMTCVLHYYKGMVMGLAIQTVMAPFNLYENALVRTLLTKGAAGLQPSAAIFDEKDAFELTDQDDIVDAQGNPVVRTVTESGTPAAATRKKKLEDILLDTWDQGAKADLTELLGVLNKKTVNTTTSADKWTPLMVLAGLGCPGAESALDTCLDEYEAKRAVTDKDGWNCLHWAAFHGSMPAAERLCQYTELLTTKDGSGKTPAETARGEGNEEIAKRLEQAAEDTKKTK